MLKLLLVLMPILPVHAGPRSQGAFSFESQETQVMVKLKEGFHFNAKAPNTLQLGSQNLKASTLEARQLVFSGLPKEWREARAMVYICDDAVTFCEAQSFDLRHPALAEVGSAKSAESRGANSPSAQTVHGKGEINAFGFIENDFPQAIERAKSEKKLILIEFSAPWCPGCVRLENEIFPTEAFQNFSKNFVKLKIDTDRFENLVLSEKFKIVGIPSLVVINADQDEVGRVLGFQSLKILEKFFSGLKAEPASLKDLVERAKKKNPRVLLNLGQRLAAAGRYEESLRYLSQIKPPPKELLGVKVEAAGQDHEKSQAAKKKYLKVLREAIEAEPESFRSLVWRTELVQLSKDAEEKLDMKKDGLSIADDLLKDREALFEAVLPDEISEFAGIEPFMVAIQRAELIEASGAPKTEIIAGWKKAAQVARELKISVEKTGPSMRRLVVLMQAGLYEEADTLSAALLKTNPQSSELQRRRVKVLVEKKKYPEAVELAQEALKQSYGRNEYMVVESLAKAYLGAGRTGEAKELLERYLGRHEMDWSNAKVWRAKLEELKGKLPKN